MPEHAFDGDTHDDPFADAAAHADSAPDYYAVLGVGPRASDDEIRRAYHRLAKLWHPDRYMGASQALRERAERRMRLLVAAHEVLSDPVRRHLYDRRHGHIADTASHSEQAYGDPRTSEMHDDIGVDAPNFAQAPRDSRNTATSEGNPNGAGQFFGLVSSVLALSVLLFVLTHGGDGGFGTFVAIGAIIMLGGLALWFFVEDSPPSRLATSWMEGVPRTSGADDIGHRMPRHKPHHRHRHGGHHAGPGHVSPEEVSASTETTSHARAADETVSATDASATFERLVTEALAGIPAEFQRHMENVVVRVQAEPTEEELASVAVREGGTLFGLYHGVSLTHQRATGAPAPEEITIYQGPTERYCHGNPRRIREQVRRTVLHELAHHFGIDHEDMPDWVR